MKGRPEQPDVRVLRQHRSQRGTSYAAVDVLPDPRIRQELSAISNWPTIPQLFVNGKLVAGGCDIVTEMYESGELAQTLGIVPPSEAPEDAPGGLRARRPAPSDQEQPRLSAYLQRRRASRSSHGLQVYSRSSGNAAAPLGAVP